MDRDAWGNISGPREVFSCCWNGLQSDLSRVLLLAALTFVIHAPALNGQFLWDDDFLAHDNPLIKSPLFVLEVFRHYLFLDSLSVHYRPVQNLSYIIDYFFWNDDTFGFHLTNIILHALSGVLLYFLLRRILYSLGTKLSDAGGAGLAFIVALIWTVHPVHSAAIDYVSGRADSLAFVFAAGGWLLFLRAGNSAHSCRKATAYIAAALCALLALCSRETALIWLALFLVHTLCFTAARRKGILLAACALILALYAGLHFLPVARGLGGQHFGWSYPVRIVLMLRALGDYGRLLVFPTNLHMERTVVSTQSYLSSADWQQNPRVEYLSVLGLIVALLYSLGCLRRGQGQRLRIFGVLWFVIGFLPISNLFDLNATVAEHWLYLPSVGALLFLAGVCLDLSPKFQRGLIAFSICAVVALSSRAALRSADWSTEQGLYEQTMASGGGSIRIALNLGQLYCVRGDDAKAEKIFRQALRDYPDYPIARTNLANALVRQGKMAEAKTLFAAGMKAAPQESKDYPRTWLAALYLAGIYQQQHDAPGALAILEKDAAQYPSVWEIVSLQAEILRQTRGPAAALPLVEKFHRENWWNYPAALAMGQLYEQLGENENAAVAFRRASWLDMHEVEALNRLAALRVAQNRFADACATQRRAIARQPDHPREYLYLSRILEKMGRAAEARAAVAQVARLRLLARDPAAFVD